MDKDASDPIVSEHELRVLIKALTKSVEYIHKRHFILTFIAGLLIGIGAGVLIANFASMGQRNLPETEILLKKSDDTLKELQQLRTIVNSLSAAKTGNVDGMTTVDEKVSDLPQRKAETVQGIKDVVVPAGTNKIHIHYARQKDKKMAEAFSDFLRKKGYASVDTERIQHKCRDIRYFHGEDRQAALLLQKQFNDFVGDSTVAKGINLKIKNLGKSYPRAQRGSLEVWVFF
jgi:DNA-directed RNA polymerase specialized sigma54-like protein